MSYFSTIIGFIVCAIALAACNKPIPKNYMLLNSKQAALPTMEHIALTANKCWFKSKDQAFKHYRLAPELKSYSGKPRILLVPYENPRERPLLVVEAIGTPAQVITFGPLMKSNLNKRIANNIKNWATGENKC